MEFDITYEVSVFPNNDIHTGIDMENLDFRDFYNLAVNNGIMFIRIDNMIMYNPESWRKHIEEVIHQTLPCETDLLKAKMRTAGDDLSTWKEYLMFSLEYHSAEI